ncbi:hypothetical protein PSET11_00788 [Arthrobacter ulcerisalmonis]|uniref:Uncharacterized protein n=1 Tax=Arthrobacter ulcerisalmonis TaxID=2483813 RepID=A0A3P5WS33_9MICC|nr:hypothetical protein PSET11_00788 [Arthrobacter ulcerisalmonis]
MGLPSLRASDPGQQVAAGAESALAQDVVAFTRAQSRTYNRSLTSLGDAFADIYTSILALGCAAAMAVSLVFALRGEIDGRVPGAGGLVPRSPLELPSTVLWFLMTYAALLGILTVARRLGPIAVTGAQGSWWLPLPVDRGPMVLPTFRRRTVGVGLGSALGYLPFSLLTGLDLTGIAHALAAGTFGAASLVVLGMAALLQHRPTLGAPAGRRYLDRPALAQPKRDPMVHVRLILVPVALLPRLPGFGWEPGVAVLALAALAAALILRVALRRAGTISSAELIRGGAVSGHAGASVFFLDANELLRAMAGEPRPLAARRAAGLYWRPARTPWGALLRADVAAFLRLQPAATVPLVWLAACVALAISDAGLPAPLQLAFVLVAGCAVASGMGTVARRTALLPELDALLPLSPARVRASRMLMPAAALALWMAALTSVLALLGAGGPLLPVLGALAGVGMGAGTLRGATRPAADWTLPPVDTPMGPVPRTQLASLMRGLDATVLSLLPTGLALYLGQALPVLLLAQAVVSGAAVLLVLLSNPATTPSGR